MFKIKPIWGSLISLGLLLGMNQISVAENRQSQPTAPVRFPRIEQPLALKVGVTLGGVALIGLELWWFLGSKTKRHQ